MCVDGSTHRNKRISQSTYVDRAFTPKFLQHRCVFQRINHFKCAILINWQRCENDVLNHFGENSSDAQHCRLAKYRIIDHANDQLTTSIDHSGYEQLHFSITNGCQSEQLHGRLLNRAAVCELEAYETPLGFMSDIRTIEFDNHRIAHRISGVACLD